MNKIFVHINRTLSLLMAMIMFFMLYSCQKSPTISSVQNEKDDKLIAEFIASHSLSPSGEIVSSSEGGSIPLSDTIYSTQDFHIVHLSHGAGVSPSINDRVDITYRGYYLHDLHLFDSKDTPTPVWLSGAIEGISKAVTSMKTASNDNPTPGKAWVIIPSRMGWGADDIDTPSVPANTCLLYYIELHSISTIEKQ